MDRRRALQRIAAGGATAAVSTTIVSRPVFANYDPPTVAGAQFTATFSPINVPVWELQLPTVTCPASATSSTPTQQWRFEVTTVSGGTARGCRPSGGSAGGFFQVPPSSVTVQICGTFQCEYAGGARPPQTFVYDTTIDYGTPPPSDAQIITPLSLAPTSECPFPSFAC
ncbi:MAG: twin-arginine translocation signal domain-containing protein [Actinomycetota bacterium]